MPHRCLPNSPFQPLTGFGLSDLRPDHRGIAAILNHQSIQRKLSAQPAPPSSPPSLFSTQTYPIHLKYHPLPAMSGIGSSALRQASRLTSKNTSLPASLRRASRTPKVATVFPQTAAASRRCYVTESKRDNAQVSEPKIETAIRLDKAALRDSGLSMGAQQDGNMLVSPMAGKSSPDVSVSARTCLLTPNRGSQGSHADG